MLAFAALLLLAGCSIATPMGPIFGAAESDSSLVTGSIDETRIDSMRSDEDWALVTKAVGEALDPANGSGEGRWVVPERRASGTIVAVGGPFAHDDAMCRAFVARTQIEAAESWYQGRACQKDTAPWAIARIASWSPPK